MNENGPRPTSPEEVETEFAESLKEARQLDQETADQAEKTNPTPPNWPEAPKL